MPQLASVAGKVTVLCDQGLDPPCEDIPTGMSPEGVATIGT